jgi:hypothetical protein
VRIYNFDRGRSGVDSANEGTQRVGPLTPALGLLREMQVDPSGVLASAGLASNALDDHDATIPYLAAGRFLQACVGHTGCRHFGLLVGQRVDLGCFGPIGDLTRTAPLSAMHC